ncbi:YitT family protein [Aeromicrobium sp. 636]|uniref:YitT family protein n=1 Tax=Aeromicrobium senzhongii TaxID=2663859 RepID=A0A8I0EU53_9ACTN|nr:MULTISPECIES: YitT family protein [Aeromicrobium]MBC9225416.1 YitT family protein [Aeromicrobium senzhongii]MCQ3997526.1 YitT family protein [Aeromicrobium sp. 636]MTB87452.1 YitT family protein [Aeromicrobium senzhongii]QNL95494.1 YitT family protein [Aeromicrobium senzhongii]
MTDSQHEPTSPESFDTTEPTAVTIPHTPAEDILGVLTGTWLASLGLHLLHEAHAVTGGTAGLSLLLTYAFPVALPLMLIVVNLPFFALAAWKKGWRFTFRSIVAVGLLSAFTSVHGQLIPSPDLAPVYGVLTGNILAGVGILILFRHGSSLGGFSVLALIAQEQAGLRAGYVQMALDVLVVVAALLVVPWDNVLLSAAGAVVLNLILAFNHRPERYRA